MFRWLVALAVLVGCPAKNGGVGEAGGAADDDDADDGDDSDDDDDDDVVGDACAEVGEVRDCELDPYEGPGPGTQYCGRTVAYDVPPVMWSECAAHHSCVPGETAACGWPDGSAYEVPCEIDETGRLDAMCSPTPLAIDLGGDGFAFEPAGARAFDIAGDASCLAVDWPVRSTAWLAIDRDGDGAIADGRELFGTGTPMPDRSRPSNGFVALAKLDQNLDGMITPRDLAFAHLVLWTDLDGDRKGTGDELLALGQIGITSLPLAYDRDRECDARGNCIVERASVTTHEGVRPLVDLHLACQ